ncbi:hypothetical protein AK812_SmicGene11492 [Symbiodinium microadriaticum]|uniref:Uncharacterized protein n=1 Tax=Symbiodinium microadriaticum TaxID=2951 RepID=A0A1Q9ED23_SYMMI|nr:hypothetical protein AK812_SmicGene11492 [Symbiodinium microadriaticum]
MLQRLMFSKLFPSFAVLTGSATLMEGMQSEMLFNPFGTYTISALAARLWTPSLESSGQDGTYRRDVVYERIWQVREWPSTSSDVYASAMALLMQYRLSYLLTKLGTEHLLGERMRKPAIRSRTPRMTGRSISQEPAGSWGGWFRWHHDGIDMFDTGLDAPPPFTDCEWWPTRIPPLAALPATRGQQGAQRSRLRARLHVRGESEICREAMTDPTMPADFALQRCDRLRIRVNAGGAEAQWHVGLPVVGRQKGDLRAEITTTLRLFVAEDVSERHDFLLTSTTPELCADECSDLCLLRRADPITYPTPCGGRVPPPGLLQLPLEEALRQQFEAEIDGLIGPIALGKQGLFSFDYYEYQDWRIRDPSLKEKPNKPS